MAIDYVKGDATAPVGPGPQVIVHIVSDTGGWGKGFVTAISKRWSAPERQYRRWHKGDVDLPFALGEVAFVEVETGSLWVANMLAQVGNYPKKGVPPIRYESVRACLARVRAFALTHGASVHMPRIGCGLAGGTWDKIGAIVEEELSKHSVQVVVYDFGR